MFSLINTKNCACLQKTYLFNEQFLAHGDALVEPFLVFLKELLLFIDLSPQVTVCLLSKDSREDVKFSCVRNMYNMKLLSV